MSDVIRELIEEAKAFDDTQEQRAQEFQRDYERLMGRKLAACTPVTWAWLRKRMLPKRYSTCLPGRIMPKLVFGEQGVNHPGYIPIERRMVLTNTRFGEIYAAGDTTPKHNMVQR